MSREDVLFFKMCVTAILSEVTSGWAVVVWSVISVVFAVCYLVAVLTSERPRVKR